MQTVAHPDVSHYTYRVTWSAEDGEFLATCAEFPSLSWLASSQIEALQGIEGVLREVIADMEEQGEQVPEPFAERSYSGKFNVRVGESLHRELAIHAAEDGMSLNQYVLRKLAAPADSKGQAS
jgi:predicted HicB family RNase H-like nuclease